MIVFPAFNPVFMDLQYLIVAFLILGAIVLAGRAAWKRTRSFSTKSGCESGCGCSAKTEKLST